MKLALAILSLVIVNSAFADVINVDFCKDNKKISMMLDQENKKLELTTFEKDSNEVLKEEKFDVESTTMPEESELQKIISLIPNADDVTSVNYRIGLLYSAIIVSVPDDLIYVTQNVWTKEYIILGSANACEE